MAGEGRLGIGGDFVDYVVHDDHGVSFVIGDVSGHGPEAEALGATLRSGWRALAAAGWDLPRAHQPEPGATQSRIPRCGFIDVLVLPSI